MYPVSNAFLQAIDSNSRNYYWSGSITTNDNRVYTFENKDIVKGSGYITRQCCGSNEIELGTVYSAEMGITLLLDIDRYTLYDAQIRLYFHLVMEDGNVESVPMGIFEITEANRTVRCLELKAYDYMLRFDKNLNLSSSSGSAYSFLLMASTECKVELAQTKAEIDAMPNGKETLGIYSDNDMDSYRDLIYYVAQVLGCVCQINRDGKLELKKYKITTDLEISSNKRFTSSYSDFITRYTAVSFTNMNTEESEYYALTPDDGLTLNLGINPLLQFGLKSTRKRLITNILNNIAIVNYVPFDSTTIGNPALDPMDIICFSGGHADASKVSCITSITYKINGKHNLRCVGKNPKLALAKSKTDKVITGLLNQVEAGKTIVYNFVNATPFTIGVSNTEVMAIEFTSKEETTATFLAEVLFEVVNDNEIRKIHGTIATVDEKGSTEVKDVDFTFSDTKNSELIVTYKMNNEEINTFYPKKTCVNGKHILTLFLPITHVIANSKNTLSVYFKMIGGTLNIGESQIRATISGQGLVAGIGDWNGKISISEIIDKISITDSSFEYDAITDVSNIMFPKTNLSAVTQRVALIPILESEFTYNRLNERITTTEVIKTFTMDKDFPPHYDQMAIEINDDGAFCMISDYVYVSSAEEINVGELQHLTINIESFERVEKTEVTLCL